MTVVRYEPWALLNRLHREFDQTFDTVARDASWAPAVDIHEEAQRFIVRADLPGVKPADIEITADKGVLTLRGERQIEQRERRWPLFARRARERQVRADLHAAGERADRRHQGAVQGRRPRAHDPQDRQGRAAPHRSPGRVTGWGLAFSLSPLKHAPGQCRSLLKRDRPRVCLPAAQHARGQA